MKEFEPLMGEWHGEGEIPPRSSSTHLPAGPHPPAAGGPDHSQVPNAKLDPEVLAIRDQLRLLERQGRGPRYQATYPLPTGRDHW